MSLTLTRALLLSLSLLSTSFSIRASDVEGPVSLFTDGRSTAQMQCLERTVNGDCELYRFQVINAKDDRVLEQSAELSADVAEESIRRAAHAYRVLPTAPLLVAGTGLAVLACAVAASSSNQGKGVCATIPLGMAVDIVKAPVVAPVLVLEGSFRGIKKAVLKQRLLKTLRDGEQRKVTRVTRRAFHNMSAALL